MKKGLLFIVSVVLLASCANRGIGPQGGPKDSIPPVPLRYEPEQGTLEFKGKRIEVTFNEYLQLNDVSSNLLMSPPQQTPPEVKVWGKKLIVQFQDSLRDSTTYTLDFGDAVCDYHEKVPLHGFTYYFSTGSEIDTLETTGYVYDAATLNPLKGILVGIHSNMEDSAFVTQPFLRIARTDSAGHFRIGNIHEGTYRIYAVEEISRDYRLTIGEALAFTEEAITVNGESGVESQESRVDSIDINIDSLALSGEGLAVKGTQLLLFKEFKPKVYLQRTTRDEQHKIQISFSASPDSLMELHPLTDSLNYHMQVSKNKDTITLWLLDSMSIAQDSLFIEARYRRTDSVYNMEWYTDTLRAVWRAPKMTNKMREAQERRNRNRRLELKTNARRGFELYDTLKLSCTSPLMRIERDSIHILAKSDDGDKPVSFEIAPHDTLPMEIQLLATFKAGERYELRLDSGALHDVYEITHVKGAYPFEMKSESDYSTLRVTLNPFVEHAQIQILDKKDAVLRELPALPEGTLFEYLAPETYYMRLYIDENGDGKWTTGNWPEHRQPEPIYYFPESIQTKSNWDFEEEWDYEAVPQMLAKPKELIKAASSKKK